jgi:signal transduction histidine kinase
LRVQPERVDLDRLCREVIDEVKASHPSRNVVYRCDGGADGEWDPIRMQQVAVNLLTNALRYSPPDTEVTVIVAADDGRTTLSVHNWGAPIDAQLQEHIFEPFKRGNGPSKGWGGVGLGLYIVKQIVVAHGGTVELSSRAETGTTFTVKLPTRPD